MDANYAVGIIVQTPNGIPLVSDPKKPAPHYWKFPGGRAEIDETPEATAQRELREETGIQLELAQLEVVHSEDRESHTFFLFNTRLDTAPSLLDQGSEQESVKYFSREEILSMPDFFPPHLALAQKFLS